MLKEINRNWTRLKYLYKISPFVMANRSVKKIIAPIYRHEIAYITLTFEFINKKYRDNKETECIVLKTSESLKVWESKIHNLIPVRQLRKYLADEKGNCVIFATRPNSNGSGRDVVAYRKIQQGVFSDERGINGKLSSDTLFINYTEVLPDYRGQKISRVLMDATQNYCRQNGINRYFGFIGSHNQPSIMHSLRWKGTKIIGKIELLSLFGGRYKRVTSWDEVKKVIENSQNW